MNKKKKSTKRSRMESSSIILNIKQQIAYDKMVKGESLFLTGMAGTGKSLIVEIFFKKNRCNKIIGVSSTTGSSALLIKGATLHSFLGIGLGRGSVDGLLKKIRKNKFICKRWENLDTLIIDEISMLSPDLFDKLEELARHIRRNKSPFGGIQVIASGDMLQLPCVGCERFCFEAKTWKKCFTSTIYLTEILRQCDTVFQNCLNNVRIGNLDKETVAVLETRVGVECKSDIGIKPTKIFSTNRDVDVINEKELDKLSDEGAEFYEYDMRIICMKKNQKYIKEKYKKHCHAVEILQICVGCQVLLIKNLDVKEGLVNGSRGIVESFKDDLPMVRFMNGKIETINYNEWKVEENGCLIMTVSQVPLKVAYAITIHRTQGMTLDCAEMELASVFEYGQAYTALSRVKELESMYITKINYDMIQAHPDALKFYAELSEQAQ
jgi:ATP-dependent DNA helicase PIF1